VRLTGTVPIVSNRDRVFLRRTIERIRDKTRPATIADVMHVISLTQNTPTAGYVAQCSFHEKAMLAAALVEVRWTGVEEFTWAKASRRMSPARVGACTDKMFSSCGADTWGS